MTEQIREQLTLFGMAISTGLAMAFVYDFIRIFRIVRKSKNIWVWIQDVIYWLVFGYVVYGLLLKYNYGGIRGYAFLGIVVGMALYSLTISRFFVKYMSLLFEKILNTLLKALKILWKPIKLGISRLQNKFSRVIEWRRERKQEKKCKKEEEQQDVQAREARRKGVETTE